MMTSSIYAMKVERPTCPFCLKECPFSAEEYENLTIARAEEGKAWAQLNLFYMFLHEKGKEVIARRWLERAADQGNAEAQYRLGVEMRVENGDVDTDESLALFRAAAVKGISKAQFGLAIGLRDKRDYEEAFRWYTFAAAQGRPVVDARVHLSQIFSNGECGQHASEERGIYWIKRAIEQENDSACCYRHSLPYEVGKLQVFLAVALIGLGKKLYGEDDTGIEPEAFYWIRQAVGNDLPEAIEMERQMIAHNSRKCYFCKKPASKDEKFQKCSRCKYPTYCGRECQIKHWQMGHKYTCYDPSSTNMAKK